MGTQVVVVLKNVQRQALAEAARTIVNLYIMVYPRKAASLTQIIFHLTTHFPEGPQKNIIFAHMKVMTQALLLVLVLLGFCS